MRGQFFSLDVFIAAIVLISGSVVLLYSIVGTTSLQESQLFTADILRETVTASVRDLNYRVLTSPIDGYANASDPYDIRNFDMTLGELIGEYHFLANKSLAAGDMVAHGAYIERRNEITRRTIAQLISAQYSYTIGIGEDITDMTPLAGRVRIQRSDAQFVVASRSIVAGIDRDREFFGPYTIEVIVWN